MKGEYVEESVWCVNKNGGGEPESLVFMFSYSPPPCLGNGVKTELKQTFPFTRRREKVEAREKQHPFPPDTKPTFGY